MYQTSFKAVLFDLDDTLIDRKSAYEYMCRRFYDLHNEINSSITWEEARKFFWNLSPNNAANITDHIKQINKRWPTIPNEPETHKKFTSALLMQRYVNVRYCRDQKKSRELITIY